jgi:hypothetical protein
MGWPKRQAGQNRGATVAGLALTETVSVVWAAPFAASVTWLGVNWQEIPADGCAQLRETAPTKLLEVMVTLKLFELPT